MPSDIDSQELRTWALKGAEQRLVEIAAEASVIYRNFPELRDSAAASTGGRELAGGRGSAERDQPRAPRGGARRRRTVSAAQRKAQSEKMRAYWAARRSAAGQASQDGESAAAGAADVQQNADGAGKRTGRRRTMSAAARKRISEGQRARWARQKGTKKKSGRKGRARRA